MAKRVLIVDDSRAVIATAELALEGLIGSGVIEFKSYLNPAELLGNLQSGAENFDLLISDVNMPEMNGLDLARSIKSDERFKTKPIIILTTESSEDLKTEGERDRGNGVDGQTVQRRETGQITKNGTGGLRMEQNARPKGDGSGI
jgi:two-component system, chemotaxis family, chemotaxis protein CheY